MPDRKTDGTGTYNSVWWYVSSQKGNGEGNFKDIKWNSSSAYAAFKKCEKSKDWAEIAKICEYIVIFLVNKTDDDKFNDWYNEYIQRPEWKDKPKSEKTPLKLAPLYFMYHK